MWYFSWRWLGASWSFCGQKVSVFDTQFPHDVVSLLNNNLLKFKTSKSPFSRWVCTSCYCFFMFYVTYTSTLEYQIRMALLFLETKLKTFYNVVFALNKNGLCSCCSIKSIYQVTDKAASFVFI